MDNKEQIEKNVKSIVPIYMKIEGFPSHDPEINYGEMRVVAGETERHEFWVTSPTLQLMVLEAYKVVWHSPSDRVRIRFDEQTNEIYRIEIFSELVA